MAISAQMVKELRERTGAGMMDCKKALVEVEGDMEKAIDWLRQKGIAKAAKKSGRTTSEGLVVSVTSPDGKHTAMASLLCETDFVARGEQFQNLAKKVVNTVLEHNPKDAEALDKIIGDEVRELVAAVGENMQLGNFAYHAKKDDNEVVGQYIHHNGKIGVLVFISAGKKETADNPKVKEIAEQLAMQVAFSNPLALDAESLDPALIEREKEIYRQKAMDEGKPANIIEKIAEGAVKKYQKDVCLMDQSFFLEEKKSIADVVSEAGKAVNDKLKVTGYERIQLAG